MVLCPACQNPEPLWTKEHGDDVLMCGWCKRIIDSRPMEDVLAEPPQADMLGRFVEINEHEDQVSIYWTRRRPRDLLLPCAILLISVIVGMRMFQGETPTTLVSSSDLVKLTIFALSASATMYRLVTRYKITLADGKMTLWRWPIPWALDPRRPQDMKSSEVQCQGESDRKAWSKSIFADPEFEVLLTDQGGRRVILLSVPDVAMAMWLRAIIRSRLPGSNSAS